MVLSCQHAATASYLAGFRCKQSLAALPGSKCVRQLINCNSVAYSLEPCRRLRLDQATGSSSVVLLIAFFLSTPEIIGNLAQVVRADLANTAPPVNLNLHRRSAAHGPFAYPLLRKIMQSLMN